MGEKKTLLLSFSLSVCFAPTGAAWVARCVDQWVGRGSEWSSSRARGRTLPFEKKSGSEQEKKRVPFFLFLLLLRPLSSFKTNLPPPRAGPSPAFTFTRFLRRRKERKNLLT
jgi:hypothetical protein